MNEQAKAALITLSIFTAVLGSLTLIGWYCNSCLHVESKCPPNRAMNSEVTFAEMEGN